MWIVMQTRFDPSRRGLPRERAFDPWTRDWLDGHQIKGSSWVHESSAQRYDIAIFSFRYGVDGMKEHGLG